jgi:hypothetical protein
MPRRVYTYQAGLGWDSLNLLESAGAFILAAGILASLLNVLVSLRRGAPAGDDPWGAGTLEWATGSPPPPYNFPVIPTVRNRDPLWEQGTPLRGPEMAEGREVLGTTPLRAEPEAVLRLPGDSGWPLLVAVCLALVFVGLLAGVYWVAALGGLLVLGGIVGWLWPTKEERAT